MARPLILKVTARDVGDAFGTTAVCACVARSLHGSLSLIVFHRVCSRRSTAVAMATQYSVVQQLQYTSHSNQYRQVEIARTDAGFLWNRRARPLAFFTMIAYSYTLRELTPRTRCITTTRKCLFLFCFRFFAFLFFSRFHCYYLISVRI